MGYYIQVSGQQGKVAALVSSHGAKVVACPKCFEDIPEGKGLVCVVDNTAFEAAGYIFSPGEFDAFTSPSDRRRKTFLLMDKAQAEQLSGFAK